MNTLRQGAPNGSNGSHGVKPRLCLAAGAATTLSGSTDVPAVFGANSGEVQTYALAFSQLPKVSTVSSTLLLGVFIVGRGRRGHGPQ
jgi:hypothetical protein